MKLHIGHAAATLFSEDPLCYKYINGEVVMVDGDGKPSGIPCPYNIIALEAKRDEMQILRDKNDSDNIKRMEYIPMDEQLKMIAGDMRKIANYTGLELEWLTYLYSVKAKRVK